SQGLGCCQIPDPCLHPPAPAPRDASPPSTVGWGSPPTVGTSPELYRAPGMGTGAWGSPPCGPAAGNLPEVLGVPDMGMGAWESPPYIPVTGTPLELHEAVASNVSSWLSPPHCAGAGAPPDLPGDPLLDAGLMLPEFVDAGTVTQDLSADLLSLLEALLPPQPQD
ncbi:PREDICTED: mesoderm posterior protein 2, partial [Aptenodytes forsteri]|uniref:mesoderm posterior protein 2 n=1 Tax=Aptenodytes forsteri TaxID=9233 RepID=UPI0004F44467